MRSDDRMPRFPRFSMACFTLLLPRSGCDLRSWLSLYERGRTASFGLRSSALLAPRTRSPASQDTLSTSHVGISCRCGWWRIVACRGCAGLHAVSRSICGRPRLASAFCSERSGRLRPYVRLFGAEPMSASLDEVRPPWPPIIMTSFVLVGRWRGVLGFRLRPESFITSSVLAKHVKIP